MGFLRSLGLHRRPLVAWASYDWANSAFILLIVTAVFPIYFSRVAAAELLPATATARFAAATTVALLVIGLLAPLLGPVADRAGAKKKFLGGFMGLGVLATGAMSFIGPGQWKLALLLFVLASIGASGSIVFYDALLPHVAREDELDQTSAAGYALGYLGGGLLLAGSFVAIARPEMFGLPDAAAAMRTSFAAVALWWLLFSLPLFLGVPEPPARKPDGDRRRGALGELARTFGWLRSHPDALLMLVAFLAYNDGISTVIRMAAVYGSELGLPQEAMLLAILMVQFVGVPFTFLFGHLGSRVGPKQAIMVCLGIYTVTAGLSYFIETATHFFALAFGIAVAQGGSQSLSRSLFASLVPRERAAEFFAFFAVSAKVAGVCGPALFAAAVTWTGSGRYGALSTVVFFVVGAMLLRRVDVERGRAALR